MSTFLEALFVSRPSFFSFLFLLDSVSCGVAGANEMVVGELRGAFWRIFGVVAADCGNFCGVAELKRRERRRAVVFVVVEICGVGGDMDCFKEGVLFEDALDFLVFGVSAIFR